MIIEDDLETLFLFSQLLESAGYSVITKSSGKAALEFLERNIMPDLICMDLEFPHGTPEEFKEELLKIKGSQNTPIIIVSGKADIADYAEKLQARNYIRKPFDISPFLSLIQETI